MTSVSSVTVTIDMAGSKGITAITVSAMPSGNPASLSPPVLK